LDFVRNTGPLFAYSPSQVDKVLFDPWSGIRAGSGIILGMLGFNVTQVLFIATVWEFITNSPLGKFIWTIVGDNHYSGDTLVNIISPPQANMLEIKYVSYFYQQVSYTFNRIASTCAQTDVPNTFLTLHTPGIPWTLSPFRASF
tara:strand:- start:525 stop:956 length:432 start_codon:yes stop_codon:yes gene_type:complete